MTMRLGTGVTQYIYWIKLRELCGEVQGGGMPHKYFHGTHFLVSYKKLSYLVIL